MSRSERSERPSKAPVTEVVYVRLLAEDLAELKLRSRTTGATIAAQIRILVHEALRARKVIR